MKWIIMVIIVLILLAVVAMRLAFGPVTEEKSDELIQKRMDKLVEKDNGIHHYLLKLYSPSTGYEKAFAAGKKPDGQPSQVDDRYHSASIGKTFTTTLALILYEEGKLDLDEPVSLHLDSSLTEGIFTINGFDYSEEVTLRQLLNHTSGAADYFEDPVTSGPSFQAVMLEDVDRRWYPDELVSFTRDHQEPVGKPGEGFHYSDTGYILAGIHMEMVTGKSLGELLETHIFQPVGTEDTNLMFYTQAASGRTGLTGIYIDGVDISDKDVMSIDWSGGGLGTTAKDLINFMVALRNGDLISQESLNMMHEMKSNYDKGIYYGMGMMTFNFKELSPMLGNMDPVYGGIGASGTLILYDGKRDMYVALELGTIGASETSIMELVQILMIYDRIEFDK